MSSITHADYIAMQARIAPKGRTEPTESYDGPERDLHEQISADLRTRGLYHVHSRMDRPTTTDLGVVDYIVALPDAKTLWLEVKRKGGKMTPHQIGVKMMLEKMGHRHECVYSFKQYWDIITL